MKNSGMKVLKLSIIALCLISFAALFFLANRGADDSSPDVDVLSFSSTGRVVQVVEDTPATNYMPRQQLLEVEVLRGELAGVIVETQHFLPTPAYRAFYEGDRVFIVIGESMAHISSPDRGAVMVGFVIFFLAFLCLIGGKRGIMSVLSLVFSLFSIVFLLVPLTLQGYPIILFTIIIASLIAVVSLTTLVGINAKSITAIIGCIFGSISAALFAWVAGHLAFINGYHTEYAGDLMFYTDAPLGTLFISGAIIAAMGAIMDIAMTIASTMEELKRTSPTISSKELFVSGLNVGRDAMGTMSNTLILAFVGSSLSLTLLIFAMDTSFADFINSDMIAIEVIKGIAGSIGIILTVPITTFLGARLFSSKLFAINNENK